MKTNLLVLFTAVCALYGAHQIGVSMGYQKAKAEIPSCLYLDRPRGNDCKPWGYDGKEGVDWHYDSIGGGGMYVDLSKWKRGW